jgi:hypothetical protein
MRAMQWAVFGVGTTRWKLRGCASADDRCGLGSKLVSPQATVEVQIGI